MPFRNPFLKKLRTDILEAQKKLYELQDELNDYDLSCPGEHTKTLIEQGIKGLELYIAYLQSRRSFVSENYTNMPVIRQCELDDGSIHPLVVTLEDAL